MKLMQRENNLLVRERQQAEKERDSLLRQGEANLDNQEERENQEVIFDLDDDQNDNQIDNHSDISQYSIGS